MRSGGMEAWLLWREGSFLISRDELQCGPQPDIFCIAEESAVLLFCILRASMGISSPRSKYWIIG